MRRRSIRAAAVGAAGVLLASVAGLLVTSNGFAAGDVYSVAPYTDMSNSQEGMLDTAITQHGLKAYTAAFVIGTGCSQIWGDTLPVGNDSYTDPEISRAKSEGASVIISSGGAAGWPLAWTCSTQSSIESGYKNILDSYGVNRLDFDVEGSAIADTAAAARQMQAMKDLKASYPSLQFSMTLPVMPTGLTADGVNIVKAAKNAGIRIDVVNLMTMDYYQGSQDMGAAAISAAQATLAQIQAVDSGYTYANIGITPMIGTNDDGSVFTLANAESVESWAAQHGIGRLSFWSVNRDQPCSGSANSLPTCTEQSYAKLAFTDAFVPYEGSGGGSTSSPTPTPTSPSPSPTASPPAGGGVTNSGFESGALSPWTCDAGTASVVSSPVHTGGHALSATPTSSVDAQCSQTVAVSPNHTYTLSGWVDGSYVYLGVTGSGVNTSTWTPGTTGYAKLAVGFTTGASTTSVTVYVHGWYAQPTFYADDVTLA